MSNRWLKFIDQHKLLKERYDMLSKRKNRILEYVSNEFTTRNSQINCLQVNQP